MTQQEQAQQQAVATFPESVENYDIKQAAFYSGFLAGCASVQGMRWIKASERLPTEIKNAYDKNLHFAREIGFGDKGIVHVSSLKAHPHIYEWLDESPDPELTRLRERVKELESMVKELIPFAEDAYKGYVSNACHQEFLKEDRETISKAKQLINPH